MWTLPTLSEQVRYLKNSANLTEKTVVNKLWNNIGGVYFYDSQVAPREASPSRPTWSIFLEANKWESRIFGAPAIYQVNRTPADDACGPWEIRDLAKWRNTYAAWENAESYLIAATAMCESKFQLASTEKPSITKLPKVQQQTICLAHPPEPDDNDRPDTSGVISSSDGISENPNFLHVSLLEAAIEVTWPNSTNTSYWIPLETVKLDSNSYVNYPREQMANPIPSCLGTPDVLPPVQRDFAMDVINNKYCPYMTTGNPEVTGATMFIDAGAPSFTRGYPYPSDSKLGLWLSI